MTYILLVEDNQQSADLAIRLLTSAGYVVKHAVKGMQAVKLAKESRPDLILMDFELPDVTGPTVALIIKKQLAEQTPPIVAVTSHVTPRDQGNARRIGCAAFIAKPYPVDQMLNTVKFLLRHAVLE